jgi:hypothetical protein
LVAAAGRVQAGESDLLAKFDGGIGVNPVLGVAAPQNPDLTFANVSQNVVAGVIPSGNPWRIGSLQAAVHTDGHIVVDGRGLVLAGGNRLGQSLFLQVAATLICTSTPPFDQHSTPASAQLDANGDFRIDDTLNSVPAECPTPLLLIRAANGTWLAAGIAKNPNQ